MIREESKSKISNSSNENIDPEQHSEISSERIEDDWASKIPPDFRKARIHGEASLVKNINSTADFSKLFNEF
jgi:hypothetical protein